MDGWFQMVLSRSKSWTSITSLALTVAEKWTKMQKLNLSLIQWTMNETWVIVRYGWLVSDGFI